MVINYYGKLSIDWAMKCILGKQNKSKFIRFAAENLDIGKALLGISTHPPFRVEDIQGPQPQNFSLYCNKLECLSLSVTSTLV
jgi:hypothetical protein